MCKNNRPLGRFIDIEKNKIQFYYIYMTYSESTVVLSSFCLSDLGVDP
jgi:hypothetical protein